MKIPKPIIITAVVLLVVSVIGYILTKERKDLQTKTSFSPIPLSKLPESELKLPTGDKISVNNKEVTNIYKDAIKVNDYGDAVFAETESYQQTYILQGKYFLISIYSTPFEDVKKAAEEEFLKRLGVSEKDACELDVRITTPYYVNPNESGKVYRLSFCE